MDNYAIRCIIPMFSFEVIDMPRKITLPDMDHIRERYEAVLSLKQVAQEFGISLSVLHRAARKAGINIRSQAEAAKERALRDASIGPDEIIALYNSGIGVRGIFNKCQIPIKVVERVLRENGINLRNRSEQQYARMERTDFSARQRLAAAANAANRGRIATVEERCKMAATYEANGTRRASVYEDALANCFDIAGFGYIRQKAVGPYNCDFAIDAIAVEVFGGGWHWHGDHLARTEERFRYIMNAGYDILVIPFSHRFPFSERTGRYLVTLINEMRSNPAPVRQYRVVWGAGDFITGGSADDDQISIEPPFTSVRDGTTGRYKRVGREA